MKIIAKYVKHLFNSKGQAELSLLIPNIYHTGKLIELDSEKTYRVNIEEVKSKRSLQQNAYMWALLNQLHKASGQSSQDWYINALIDADVQPKYIVAVDDEEMVKLLKQSFRVIKSVAKRDDIAPNAMGYNCYLGTSKFTKKEMSILLEHIFRYCTEYNIETDERFYE